MEICDLIIKIRIMLPTLLLAIFCAFAQGVVYDSYSGKEATPEELAQFEANNITSVCTNNIVLPCNPNEPRRWDGSCNNLQSPARGATQTPFYRYLPPVWAENTDYQPRLSESGKPLATSRSCRVQLLSEGRVPDLVLTQMNTHYWMFMVADITSQNETVHYIRTNTHCCQPEGKTDPMCAAHPISDDDPVFRYSDIRCLNMTRPLTFQSTGCIAGGTSPERIISATPLSDMSTVYGVREDPSRRAFTGGLLNVDIINGKEWPPIQTTTFFLEAHFLGTISFWRYHNFVAKKLAALNPCWTDDQLFYTARDINIATANQINNYEMLPFVMGKDNLIKDQIISSDPGFRDLYDENVLPQMALEYPLILRWLHVMQDGYYKYYDAQGNYLQELPVVNLTGRMHPILTQGDTLAYMTQGAFRQPSANINDYIVDPIIAGYAFGIVQRAGDAMTSDLAKFRYSGVQPYVKYRELCFGETYSSFDDLANIIDPERIEILKQLYESVNDIDLLSGAWVEKRTVGFFPPIFYCLVAKQIKRTIVADRHWYERPNRPNAFTAEQLAEIRKTSVSRILCDVGDSVTEIQPNAFEMEGPSNKIGPCSNIRDVDFSQWKDAKCSA